jgi:uncharacterized membrane protein YbhN (UPF0104 family)
LLSVAEADTAVPDTTPVPQPAPRWRGRLFLALRVLTVLVVAIFVVRTTVQLWPEVRDTITGLSTGVVLGATLAAALAMLATALAWRAIVADLGHQVPVRDAAQINLVGQLGKYVPGSVWAYVLQAQLARRVGIPGSRGFLASLMVTILGITAGITIGSLGLPAIASSTEGGSGAGRAVVYVALAILPFALVFAHPWVLTRAVGIVLRLARREPLRRSLSWRAVLAAIGWAVVGYAFSGVHLWLLAGAVAGTGVRGLVACTVAFALAMTAGVFAFILPSGIGVREFVIAATLAGAGVPYGRAYALALVSRLLFTVADVGTAGVAALAALRRVRAESPAGSP